MNSLVCATKKLGCAAETRRSKGKPQRQVGWGPAQSNPADTHVTRISGFAIESAEYRRNRRRSQEKSAELISRVAHNSLGHLLQRAAHFPVLQTTICLAPHVHVAPLAMFDVGHQLSMVEAERHRGSFAPPMRSDSAVTVWQATPDGLLVMTNASGRHVIQAAYGLAFRSGLVEGVALLSTGEIDISHIDRSIVAAVHRYATGLEASGITPPFVAMASLVGAKNTSFKGGTMFDETRRPDRDQVHFVEAMLEVTPASIVECGRALAPDASSRGVVGG